MQAHRKNWIKTGLHRYVVQLIPVLSCLSGVLTLFFFAPMAHAANLSLSPTTLEVHEANQGVLTVNLDPQGEQVIGTDVFLTYDPERLKVISVQNRTTIPGNPATIIENARGVTKFSLINAFGVYTSVPGPLADITVQPLTDQTTTVTIKHTPGNTADSNVAIDYGLDALTSVQNATIVVTGTGNQPTPTPTLSPTPSALSPSNTTVLPDLNPTPPGFANAVKTTRNNQLISPIPEDQLATPGGIIIPPGLIKPNAPNPPGRTLGTQDEPINAKALPSFPWLALSLPKVLPLIVGILSLVSGIFTYWYFKRRQQNPPPPETFTYSVSY